MIGEMALPLLCTMLALLAASRGGRAAAVGRARLLIGPSNAAVAPSAGRARRYLHSVMQPRHRYDVELGEALSAMARAMRSGASFPAAIGEGARAANGQVAVDLAEVGQRVSQGDSWSGSLAAWQGQRPQRCVALAAGGLAVGLHTGTASARVLDSVVETIRIGVNGGAEARAFSAQARSSVAVLVACPLVFLFLSGGFGGSATAFLVGTPLGLLCLAGGLVLDAGAAWWMRSIIRSVR